MNILFLQHGDFAEAHGRMTRGDPETYRDQYRSVRFVADLAAAGHQVTIVAIRKGPPGNAGANTGANTGGNAPPEEAGLAPGLAAITVGRSRVDRAWCAGLLARLQPDRLICRTPHLAMLAAARARDVPTLPCFADLFGKAAGLGGRWRRHRLRRALAGPNVACIANHSLNASRSVVTAGLAPAGRVVPWDWSRLTAETVPKAGVADPAAPHLVFAGSLTVEKGVGDVIAALGHLRKAGLAGARLTVAGPGDLARWQAEAEAAGLTGAVDFRGRIPNTEVRRLMAGGDIVIVASRHGYPEGLPNTIYEALASRSALVLSDHPAFAGRIEPEAGGLFYPAADPAALAGAVLRLCREPGLYARLSASAPQALDGLYVGLDWTDLVTCFLADPAGRDGWVGRHALPALGLAA